MEDELHSAAHNDKLQVHLLLDLLRGCVRLRTKSLRKVWREGVKVFSSSFYFRGGGSFDGCEADLDDPELTAARPVLPVGSSSAFSSIAAASTACNFAVLCFTSTTAGSASGKAGGASLMSKLFASSTTRHSCAGSWVVLLRLRVAACSY